MSSFSSSDPSERFLGVRHVSQKGRHEIIRFAIPGTRMAHIFSHQRSNANYSVFRCRECKKRGHYKAVKVVGNEIIDDPLENHVCVAINSSKDQANRIMYEVIQNIRSDSRAAHAPVSEIWEKTLHRVLNEHGSASSSNEVVAYFYKNGLESRRKSIERAKAVHGSQEVTWDNIPESYNTLDDGTLFLQERNDIYHLYYSSTTIREGDGPFLKRLESVESVWSMGFNACVGSNINRANLHAYSSTGNVADGVHIL
ncbi:unnamed protein product [Cylicostephanus goldi]|uniref:Uncharacterized protein n=1 Tax=Cylicostephanus goldi TaxID=71465 RepID=A0A3P6PYH1_CYLGO|nr:unnamed protein product [Cylicostephanus goldi]